MIRNAVVHMANEQPLFVDLRALPTAEDACLVCTNLRYLNGKKPSFTDHIDSWFLIPLGMIRFVEVPAEAIAKSESDFPMLPAGPITEKPRDIEDEPEDDESESELLRRMREV